MKTAVLLIALALPCFGQKQVTFASTAGPVEFGPNGLRINTAFFQSASIVDLLGGQELFVYKGANPDFPLMGLSFIQSGPLTSGSYSTVAHFGAGGLVAIDGNAYLYGVYSLRGTFVRARWAKVGDYYQISGTVTGTLSAPSLSGIVTCTGEMSVSGRTVSGGYWMQYLDINATNCQ